VGRLFSRAKKGRGRAETTLRGKPKSKWRVAAPSKVEAWCDSNRQQEKRKRERVKCHKEEGFVDPGFSKRVKTTPVVGRCTPQKSRGKNRGSLKDTKPGPKRGRV